MAFCIYIDKVIETDTEVRYSFYDTAYPDEAGELRLDKGTTIISMTKPSRESFFDRAAMAVARCWKEGVYPERTYWMS